MSPVIAVFDAEKHDPIAASAMDVEYVKYSSWAEKVLKRRNDAKQDGEKAAAIRKYCLKVKDLKTFFFFKDV